LTKIGTYFQRNCFSTIEFSDSLLGEHNEEVFRELGISKEEIDELVKDKLV
jgi:crotonobetainyl-CoA:carnitine CoA-transferase CaiB-like acyl-CoA transferase